MKDIIDIALDKMTDILQTTFLNAFSSSKEKYSILIKITEVSSRWSNWQ